MQPTSVAPFRRWYARPGMFKLEVVGNRVCGDVARRAVNAATVASRRSAEIETFDRSPRARQQRMRSVDPELRRDVGAHADRASHHVDIEPLDIERGEQELGPHVLLAEIGGIFPPHAEDTFG